MNQQMTQLLPLAQTASGQSWPWMYPVPLNNPQLAFSIGQMGTVSEEERVIEWEIRQKPVEIWEENLAGRPTFIIITVLANEPNAQI